MIGSTRQLQAWACAEPVDMRLSYDSLMALVQQTLGRDVLGGDLFLFVGRSRRLAKVMYWDGTGLCILSKRLEQGRFNAPWLTPGARNWQLTTTELALFLEGSQVVGFVPVSPPPLRR
jgi:transposase